MASDYMTAGQKAARTRNGEPLQRGRHDQETSCGRKASSEEKEKTRCRKESAGNPPIRIRHDCGEWVRVLGGLDQRSPSPAFTRE